jgi:hypothetical protein
MNPLSKSDAELVKLRAAKMSTKTIAMLMGGRWTEAKVYNRLAEIDGQVEATSAPALPALHRIDEDLPDDRPVTVGVDLGVEPAVVTLVASGAGPAQPSVLLQARLDEIAQDPELMQALLARLSSATAPPLSPAQEPPHAREADDQSSSVVAAAPDPGCADAPPQAHAVRAIPTQADDGPAAETPPPVRTAATAPNPFAVHAAPIVPVLPVRRRKAPEKVPLTPTAWAQANRLLAPTPAPRQPARGGAMRLRPLTEKIARYGAWFLAARWPLDEIAELFDVAPDALGKVIA